MTQTRLFSVARGRRGSAPQRAGVHRLNCTTRGCRQPCVLRFSLAVPRAVEPAILPGITQDWGRAATHAVRAAERVLVLVLVLVRVRV